MTTLLSTLCTVLAVEPANTEAMQTQVCALELEVHMCNLDVVRRRGEWSVAHIALNQCLQVIEAKGSEIPTKW